MIEKERQDKSRKKIRFKV